MIIYKNDFLIVELQAVAVESNKPTCYDVISNGNFAGKAVYGDVYRDLIFFAVNEVEYRDLIVAALPDQLN